MRLSRQEATPFAYIRRSAGFALLFLVSILAGCGGSRYASDAEATEAAEEFVKEFFVERRLHSALELASPAEQFHLPSYYRRYVIRGDLKPVSDVELQTRCQSTGFGAHSSDEPCYAVKLCGRPFLTESRERKTLLFGTLYLWVGQDRVIEAHAHVGGGHSFPAEERLPDNLARGDSCVK